jgi:MFS family permease
VGKEECHLHRLCYVGACAYFASEGWLTSVSAVIGAVLQTAAMNLEMLFVGRVIGGIASGIVFGVCPMFMSEISPPEFRGRVGGLYNLNINLGYTC